MTKTGLKAETQLYDVCDVADFLLRSPLTVQRMCRAGRLPGAFKLGGEWRIRHKELAKHLEELAERWE